MTREIDITDYESTIDNKVRKMKEPSEAVEFEAYHSISIYHCTVYGNECSFIRHVIGIDISDTYNYGHASIHDIAENYIDYKAAETDDPLMLAYYWYCYTKIGKTYDFIPGINHNLKGHVAIVTVSETIDGYIRTDYVTVNDEPASVLTFENEETALAWYEESDMDIKVFTIPASYVDTFDYSITPLRVSRS